MRQMLSLSLSRHCCSGSVICNVVNTIVFPGSDGSYLRIPDDEVKMSQAQIAWLYVALNAIPSLDAIPSLATTSLMPT